MAEFIGLTEEALSVFPLQNFSAPLERDILSSGNNLQFPFFCYGFRLVHGPY